MLLIAIASLVPLDSVTRKASTILRDIASSSSFRFNTIHGALTVVKELLWNIHRHKTRLAADQSFVLETVDALTKDVLPALKQTMDFLKHSVCAAVHLALLNIAILLREIVDDKAVVSEYVHSICLQALRWNPSTNRSEVLDSVLDSSSALPFDGLMWKSAMEEIVSSPLNWNDGHLALNVVNFAVFYLDHVVSEVRLGLMNGLLKWIAVHASAVHSEDYERLLAKLLSKCQTEVDPPVLHLTLLLLCRYRPPLYLLPSS